MTDNNFMEEGMDIVVLTDEEGNETQFEIIDVKEFKGNTYYALIPLEDDAETDEAVDFVILKSEKDENGEEILVTVDDDEEFYDVADLFEDIQFDELEYEDEDDN